MADKPADPYAPPELLDRELDINHRSYMSAVCGVPLRTFHARVPMSTMPIHPTWVPKLRAAGLLPIARLVEGDMLDADLRPVEKATRFQFDMSLLAALLDRWRPETHTFHLPVGEMAPTLQDVALLLGLPCAGQAVAAVDVPADWRDDLLGRFAGVQRNARAAPYRTFTSTHGPTKKWLMQFSADFMRDDADDLTVARHFEAYLLWLFGWIMFCSSQGNSAPKHLVPFARAIAEAPLEDVPQYSWGSAVLVATYRGLCSGCFKSSSLEPIFVGCPLLLQLWAHERFPVGRPRIDTTPYRDIAPDIDDRDRPTMGSMWCLRKPSWVGVQTKKSYPNFVGMFDALVDSDVRWTPYTVADIYARSPSGLSSLCLRDQEYWMTRKPLVYDIHVEEYAVHRVLRQFDRYQPSPLPITHSVPSHAHRWTC
ncbi:unnamed protein product [Urochloa humidicola]